jgi:hypothetical protein
MEIAGWEMEISEFLPFLSDPGVEMFDITGGLEFQISLESSMAGTRNSARKVHDPTQPGLVLRGV